MFYVYWFKKNASVLMPPARFVLIKAKSDKCGILVKEDRRCARVNPLPTRILPNTSN